MSPEPATSPTLRSETDLVAAEAFTPAAAPRRVLVYAPLAYSTPHFETDLEIAQRHLDLGDDVELVLCDGDLPSCQLNPAHESKRCLHCVSRNLQGVAQLSRPVKVRSLLAPLTTEDSVRLGQLPTEFATQKELRDFHFDGFDAGMATLSSLIDFARALTFDTRQHATIIRGTLTAAVASFLAMKRLLAAGRYDRVYIYNGRWSMVRSAVRACEQAGIDYYTHERGSDFRRFSVFPNTFPHDRHEYRRQILFTWDAAGDTPSARELGAAFFHERRARVEKTWFSFTKLQDSGRLPADWMRSARRIVAFTSSEFELAAISENALGRIYPTQVDAVRRLAFRLHREHPGIHLWVRVHPNDQSLGAVLRWQSSMAGLCNVTLIPPDAPIDSYALLDAADRVLTFGSTIGVETTYWNRTVVCADNSLYDGTDVQYEAATEAELLKLLTTPTLPPKSRDAAIRCGFYLNTCGDTFRHFSTEEISDYQFKSPFRGRSLRPDFTDLAQRVLALHQAGDDYRVAPIARHFTALFPSEPTMQAIAILTHLRERDLAGATAALERVPAVALETVLKHTGKALLDATQLLARSGAHEEFRLSAGRLGAAMRQTPTFSAIGQKLIAMAERTAVSA